MPFTIPNNDVAFDPNQATWMEADIAALIAGITGNGVLTGCAVTAQGSPNMTVAVAAGVVRIANLNVYVAAGNGTIATANATNPRIDLVSINSSGSIVVTAGTAAVSPKPPDLPASSAALAMVYVPANDTTINSNQIIDKRADVGARPISEGLANQAGQTYIGLPGVDWVSVTTLALTAGRIFYGPFFVVAPVSVTALHAEVATLAASTNIRLGLFVAGADQQPGKLLYDGGSISSATAGVKTATLGSAVTLWPGRYLTAIASDGAPTMRVVRGGGRGSGLFSSLGSSPINKAYKYDGTYGAYPDPGNAHTSNTGGTTPFEHMVFMSYTVL